MPGIIPAGQPPALGSQFTRRSLGAIRRLLAQSDEFQSLTLVTVSTPAATAGTIISNDLVGGLDANQYRSAWVMPVMGLSAGEIRRVGERGLNTSNGELTMATPFSVAVPANAEVEIHTELPPSSRDRMRGLRQCINAALAEMWLPVRLPLTGVNGQPTYDLSAYADWLAPDAIYEVYGPALDRTLVPAPWPAFDPQSNNDALTLNVTPTFQTGAAAQVGAFRPGNTWTKVNGVWGPATNGLSADTDETVFQPELVVQIALQHVYAAMATTGEQTERSRWQSLADRQRARANMLKLTYLPHDQRRSTQGYRSGYDPKNFATW